MPKKRIIKKKRPKKEKLVLYSPDIPKIKKELKETGRVSWNITMTVGDKILDNQHKKIIGLLDDLLVVSKEVPSAEQLMEVRKLIHSFDEYSMEHFKAEEEYMNKYGYPGLSKHHKIHETFIKFLNKLKKDFEKIYLSREMFLAKKLNNLLIKSKNYLLTWFMKHILIEDHKYYLYIEKVKFEEKHKKFDVSKIKEKIEQKLGGEIIPTISEQRAPLKGIPDLKGKTKEIKNFIKTGVPGFDELFEEGIPEGNSVLVAGGAGSGKTIFCLQTLNYNASNGKKCFYMSFEENEEKLKKHMEDFGWDAKKLIKSGKLRIERMSSFDITRNVDAMLAKEKGELLIELEPIIIPKDFKPDFVVLDSLTAIASAFTGKEDSYRIYIEQLFRFLEKMGCTSFLITETKQIPEIFSTTGVEEFLADGVIVFYNLKKGDVRENAIEVLKMRGEKHKKKIVAMQITDTGITVYPEQEVFENI